jgi:hypothetical protein
MNVLHIVYPVDMPLERKYVLLEELTESTFRRRITREIFANICSYHYDDLFSERDMDDTLVDITDVCIGFTYEGITGVLMFREHGDWIEGKALASRSHCGGKLLRWVEQRILPRRPYITKIICRSSLQAVNFYAKYGFVIDWEHTGMWIVMKKDLAHPSPSNVPMIITGMSNLARVCSKIFQFTD